MKRQEQLIPRRSLLAGSTTLVLRTPRARTRISKNVLRTSRTFSASLRYQERRPNDRFPPPPLIFCQKTRSGGGRCCAGAWWVVLLLASGVSSARVWEPNSQETTPAPGGFLSDELPLKVLVTTPSSLADSPTRPLVVRGRQAITVGHAAARTRTPQRRLTYAPVAATSANGWRRDFPCI